VVQRKKIYLMKYKAYTLKNFREIPQIKKLSEPQKRNIEVVGHVLPFKTSSYIVDELIDWDNLEKDPFFILTFPQKEMLKPEQFNAVEDLLFEKFDKSALKSKVRSIRRHLNPNPAGQNFNVPIFDGEKLQGIQHKYRETMLCFPAQGQTCHAYCTFCFRWPQFAMSDFKFSMTDPAPMVDYLKSHPEVSDILFTGGDPMVMQSSVFSRYFDTLLDANISTLHTIRIGTKSLTYWPYRFTTDKDADDLLRSFEKIIKRGVSVSIMAHFNHPRALETAVAEKAISRILSTGAQIRTQSPVLKNINDNPSIWSAMWRKQVDMGLIPYYMFIARDTGAQDYFAVPLGRAIQIYNEAYTSVSGICRTVRGPSMSCDPGKVHLVGISEIKGEKVFVLRFLQARNPEWSKKVFFAKYDPDALWLSDLVPAFGVKEFFFMDELNAMHESRHDLCHTESVH
jgi:L-lysine 2,3-aminomutase